VAAYARVSTDSEEQENSFAAQVDYYTKYIVERPDWEMTRIYTDEGISAVNTKRREGFKRMVADGLAGAFDLLVTKSVSRFARNTVDSLQTIRNLKDHGVECYFEKEAIWTFDDKGELLLTIMSSLAQEESRSISANVTWGQRKRFADGKVTLPYKRFLGYERGADGRPRIVEREAAIVRRMYQMYLHGQTIRQIADQLTKEGIPTPGGKSQWSVSTVKSILTNEKYKGEALLQKSFCENFLTKKMVKNEGQVPQYYVERSHPAIVSVETFECVQRELARNALLGSARSAASPFSGKVFCAACGERFIARTWHSRDAYKKQVWQCGGKYRSRDGARCKTTHLTAEQMKRAFVLAFNQLITDKERYLSAFEPIVEVLTNTLDLDTEAQILQERSAGLYAELEALVSDNTRQFQDQGEYRKCYAELSNRYESVKAELEKVSEKRQSRVAKRESVCNFLETVRQRNSILVDFDEELWITTAEKLTVHSLDDLRVCFRDGQEISVSAR
jgi:DNA invertase Pin-like site-specific DNA recombinase